MHNSTDNTNTQSTSRRRRRAAALAVGGSILASACGLAGPASTYDYACPTNSKGEEADLATLSFLDLSGSGQDLNILGERLDLLQVELERVADCDGRATVIGFTSSTAAHQVLFDHHFDLEGATEIARDLNLPDEIADAMAKIGFEAQKAIEELPSDATDANTIFVLGSEFATAHADADTVVEIYGFTDGINTTGDANLNVAGLDNEAAIELADYLTPTDLSDVDTLTIRGIGKVAGDAQPPTDYVSAVRAHWQRVCDNSGATTCTITIGAVSR